MNPRQIIGQGNAAQVVLARRHLRDFTKLTWSWIEQDKLEWNWHMDALCDELEAAFLKSVRHQGSTDESWNVPPGGSKSTILNVFFPAWSWIDHPWYSFLCAAGSENLGVRDSDKCRQLIEHPKYRELFSPKWELRRGQNAKKLYVNTAGGFRQSVTVGEYIPGLRGHALLIDDANDTNRESKEQMEKKRIWHDRAAQNRLKDYRNGIRFNIQQRTHEEDLTGHLARLGYKIVAIPMEYKPTHPHRYDRDPRKHLNELLHPERFPQHVVDQQKRILGSFGAAGQLDQWPIPEGGGMFKKADFRFWRRENDPEVQWRPEGCSKAPAIVLPKRLEWVATSTDCAFKDLETSDMVAIGLWAGKGADRYRFAGFHDVAGIMETLRELTKMIALAHGIPERYGQMKHLVEDKANGPAVVQMLRGKVPGIKEVTPEGGKEARAWASVPEVEAGQVYLRDGDPENEAFLAGVCSFPKGRYDDVVDEMTQLLNHFRSGGSFAQKFAAAVKDRPETIIGRL